MNEETEQRRPIVRILIADDFAEWRFRAKSILSRPEWQIVSEVSDGLEAVQKAKELCPDIALLDIGMPRMNGIEAAKRIGLELPNCKIIFVTQNTDEDLLSAARETGAEACC